MIINFKILMDRIGFNNPGLIIIKTNNYIPLAVNPAAIGPPVLPIEVNSPWIGKPAPGTIFTDRWIGFAWEILDCIRRKFTAAKKKE